MPGKRSSEKDKNLDNKKPKLLDIELLGSDLTVLEKFVHLLETGDLEDDLIQAALSSTNILNILTYLDAGTVRKSSELGIVFKALYMLILMGLKESGSEVVAVVQALAEGVLEDLRFTSCIRGLRPNHGTETNKAALRLLAVVATVNTNLARGLLRTIPFGGQELSQCSRRRNTADTQDVRSCFLNLIAAFIFSGNDLVIREAIEKKSAFSMVISECYIDKYENVMLILEMLCKIAENRTISKTQKVRLFDRNSLKHLIYLYKWRGDAVTLQELAAREDEDVDSEQLNCIRAKVHQLLVLLTTSLRLGLVFSGRHRDWQSPANDLILYALVCPPMSSAHSDPLQSELIVSSLFTCPDIIAPYLDHVAPLLYPRATSANWFSLINLICQIYDRCKLNLIKWAVMAIERSATPQQAVQVILDCSFLSQKMISPLSAALQFEESADVVSVTEELMNKLRDNVIILLTWFATTDQFPSSTYNADELKMELRLLLRERVPTTALVKKFNRLFDEDLRDPSVLRDQTFLSQPEVSKPSSEETPLDENEEQTRTAEDDFCTLKQIPKALRKPLERLYKSLTNGTDCSVSESRLRKALTALPQIMEACIQDHFHTGVVLRCLAHALRLRHNESFSDCYDGGIKKVTKKMFKLLIAHPQFASVLHPDWISVTSLAEHQGPVIGVSGEEHPLSSLDRQYIRDALIELLLELTQIRPKLCLKNVPPLWILHCYTATLASRDRNILEILFLMESHSPGLLADARHALNGPLVWGPTVVRHYRFPEDKAGTRLLQPPVLFHQPNLSALFHCVDAERLRASCLQFPLKRKWLTQTTQGLSIVTPESDSDSNLYDPSFLLHVFHHYLQLYRTAFSQSSEVNAPSQSDPFLRTFYSNHCLSYAVSALSSYSKHIRSMARSVIADYRDLADHWKAPLQSVKQTEGQATLSLRLFPERSKIVFILDTLRNSLASGGGASLGGSSRKHWMFSSKADTGGRLTRVHANFFVLALQLLSKPENLMYRSLWNCLLSKPAIDLNQVPDFLRTFFSTDNHFRAERHWISRLCVSSLADGADYLVLERSRVFKHMLTAYSSPSSDATFQLTVLQLLQTATSQPRLMHALIRFHALPVWLWRFALQPCPEPQVELFRAILNNMVNALTLKKEVESPCLGLIQLLKDEFERVQTQSRKPCGQPVLVNGT